MKVKSTVLLVLLSLAVLAAVTAPAVLAAEIEISLPLGRHAYQTNEQIYLAIVRSDTNPLKAGDLKMTLTGSDGSTLNFGFPVKAAPINGNDARCVEHVLLNGWLLRPGSYKLAVLADDATANIELDIFSHIRKSSFITADWGNYAAKNQQILLGEDSVGFNVNLAAYGGILPDEMIRGGTDFMRCCTMGGAHQMDIRLECDWSDPYVLQGGEVRVVREAMQDRVNGNCIGVHFYDEPGLTWWKHPKTGAFTPHNIPAQERSFQSAYGQNLVQYCDLKMDNAEQVSQWTFFDKWKLSFMDAAWKYSSYGVSQVRPDFISCTQSVYGWNSYCDGYYWPITRSLPLIAGHGGYDDLGFGYMFPSYTFEFGRMRDLNKPNWYLPGWYSNTPADHFRVEQYLAFMNNLQGMMTPPDHRVHLPSVSAGAINGIVESNKLFSRLGTIFTTMPITRPQTALLYSISHNIHCQTQHIMEGGNNFGNHESGIASVYLASKMNQTPVFPICDEDIVDGTLAANHKAVILAGVDYLDPKVVSALEAFAAGGGTVLMTDDCKVEIKNGTKLGMPVDYTLFQQIGKAWADKRMDDVWKLDIVPNYFKSCTALAKALQTKLRALSIQPVFETESNTLAASRQALADVEYDFAVNITPDPERKGKNNLKPLTASIAMPDDGRPIYDAITGGVASQFAKKDATQAAEFRFGPGEMRVFARTARPIGSVQVLPPVVYRDYTLQKDPIRLELGAMVADTKGRVLCGSIPLHIRVIDPLGATRYELFRATDKGSFHIDLPLALNDANGQWTVIARELLANTEDTQTFTYTTPKSCGAIAGSVPRATYFSDDRAHIFKFFRANQNVTIVAGSSSYDHTAAEKIAVSLKPWGVRSTVVDVADVAKPRTLTEEEAKTWCGLSGGTRKPSDAHIANTGFALQGPAVLVGTPDDNALIKFAQDNKFLPYAADKVKFPGPGRGYIGWQRDAVTYGQESVTVIAYDQEGMDEAAGTLYEAAAGLDPLLALNPPASNTITPATQYEKIPALKSIWQTALADRAAAHKLLADGSVVLLTADGTVTKLDAAGKTVWSAHVDGGEKWALDAANDGSLIAVGASQHLVGIDGSGKPLFDIPFKFHEPGVEGTPVSPCAFVAISPDKTQIAAGSYDAHMLLLDVQGKQKWITGGVTDEEYANWQAATKEWDAGAEKRAAEMAEYKKVMDAYTPVKKAWEDGAKERDAKTAEFKKAHDKWAQNVKVWEKKKEGEKPTEPTAPVLAVKPDEPKRPNHPGHPQQPRPAPFLAARWTADSKSLMGIADNTFTIIEAEKGTLGAKQGGVKIGAPFLSAGENFIVSDGQSKVALFSPATGKNVKQALFNISELDAKTNKPKLSPAGIYAVTPLANGGALVATENVPTVYCLKALEGDQTPPVAWKYTDPRRLVKFVAAKENLAAVVYWGGWMTVLDINTGERKFAQDLGQDATFATWSADKLLVGTADGRVTALSEK